MLTATLMYCCKSVMLSLACILGFSIPCANPAFQSQVKLLNLA